MKEFFLNPVSNIIISQTVVIWSLVLSHYSEKQITKKLTLFAAIPLTVYTLFIGVNELRSSKDSSQYLNSLIERIEKKVIYAEDILTVLNTDIENVSRSMNKVDEVVKDVNEIADVTKNLKTTLSALNTDIQEINIGLQGLSETQNRLSVEVSKQIDNFTKSTQTSLTTFSNDFTQQTKNSLRDVISSTNNTVQAMHKLDQKYIQIITSLENQRAEIATNFQNEMAQRQQEFLMNQNQQMMQQNQNMLNNMMRFPRF